MQQGFARTAMFLGVDEGTRSAGNGRWLAAVAIVAAWSLAGCTAIGAAGDDGLDYVAPDLPDVDTTPGKAVEVHEFQMLFASTETCDALYTIWIHPAGLLRMSTPNVGHWAVPSGYMNHAYEIAFGDTGEELEEYVVQIEYADLAGQIVGYSMQWAEPGATVDGAFTFTYYDEPDPPYEPTHVWIWHCAGLRGEASLTVFDTVVEPDA